jgi:ligand-binding sensor domain-containing protein
MPELVSSQGRIGEWRAHISYHPVICVSETAESVVAATSHGILLLNKSANQLTTMTKTEGLSEVGITAIAYSQTSDYLLIGYKSGNLDLLRNGQLINFPDIFQKSGLQDKTINRIVCEGAYAYLCCAFGIVKVDLGKREVAETWYFGTGNELIGANDLAAIGGKWIVASNAGIFMADRQNINLQDYRNWKRELSLPQPNSKYSTFANFDGKLVVHHQSQDQLLGWNGTTWQNLLPEIQKIRSIRSSPSGMTVITMGEIWLVNKSGNSRIDNYHALSGAKPIDPRDALTDGKGVLWIGDYNYGLTCRSLAAAFDHFLPNAPAGDIVTALKPAAGDIFAATAHIDAYGGSEAAYSIYQEGIWQNFTSDEDPGLKSIQPFTSFSFSKINPDEYWASTAGSGLLYFKKYRVAEHYNEQNSGLGAIGGSCVVNGVALDGQNNLWYTNPTGKVRLGSCSAKGNFIQLPYPGMDYTSSPTGEILISSTNIHWVVLPGEGLFAYRSKGNPDNISDDQYRKIIVQSLFSNGSSTLISQFSNISSIAEDHYNQLWVGTGSGVVVYNNPDNVFDPELFYGRQPSLEDGEGIFKPILEKERVTSIAIDGGNRKWFGTANSGLFLFDEGGNHLLKHFDSSNSPLLSSHILSLAISPGSGELFIATNKGLVSYKGEATEGANNFSNAYVWPNPLRETFHGVVTIDGLTDNTDVRITDIGGNLLYKTTSLGGRAVWNGLNSKGTRVSTGVYLIFCSSPNQKRSKIIKLLVIH